ncbi:glycosyltransferase [soil metagenome]
MSKVAVITLAHGRHDHLERQAEGLSRSTRNDFIYIVVAIDDPELSQWKPATLTPDVVSIPRREGSLPLASARNRGAARALSRGAEILIFLDVDCIPSRQLVEAYRDAASVPSLKDSLLCGPVAYLPPPPVHGYDLDSLSHFAPHPARPSPMPGEVEIANEPDLFWSLSFALTAHTWRSVGGFHEEYVGYGAEDTDFAYIAQGKQISMTWIGSARAYHQHHETSAPPSQHLDDILRNGEVFQKRWGWWPMRGWLDEFERLGLIERCGSGYAQRTIR